MSHYRTERDSLGEVRVPRDAYYGAQTQRAVENFPISGRRLPEELIHALGLVKWAAAQANTDLGRWNEPGRHALDAPRVEALLAACQEVAEGRLDGEFPVDVYQTGSGTSSNMNANEVIANRAIELSGGDRRAAEKPIHPNDHVNLGQSSNDVFPTAIHVAAAVAIHEQLIPVLGHCAEVLGRRAREWQDVLKLGRTHLNDATPMTLGQEIGGLARQMERSVGRASAAMEALLELPIGGTAVGTGVNTHPDFARRACEWLARRTGVPFCEAVDHFEANAQRDGLVECHAELKAIAVAAFAVANNLRWLASGPRAGIGEIRLPERQPGSSIMPGKVNPVLCESVMQAAARVVGNDQAVTLAGAAGGQFQLNVMMPLIADAVLESLRVLGNSLAALTTFYLGQMTADVEACRSAVERSLALATALVPQLGYDQATAVAKEAWATGETIREVCRRRRLLSDDQLDAALDPLRMARPHD